MVNGGPGSGNLMQGFAVHKIEIPSLCVMGGCVQFDVEFAFGNIEQFNLFVPVVGDEKDDWGSFWLYTVNGYKTSPWLVFSFRLISFIMAPVLEMSKMCYIMAK